MQMAKRFTLENMQTYFHNYVPCDRHREQPITNFCTEGSCFRVMCPECVQQHSKQFDSHYVLQIVKQVESIKSCISRSSNKINKAVSSLQADAIFPAGVNTPEEYTQKILSNLRTLRKEIIDEVNSCFEENERIVENEIRTRWKQYQSVAQNNSKLEQAMQELQVLHDNLFLTTTTVQAIKKISLIDFKSLCDHFRMQSQRAKATGNLELSVTVDEDKRKDIRRLLFSLLEIGKKHTPPHVEHQHSAKKASAAVDKSVRVVQYEPAADKKLVINSLASKSLYPAQQTSPIKADKGVLEITQPNSVSTRPYLHFFQTNSSNLHLLSLDQLQKQLVDWRTIQLNIDFDIPAFHKSVMLRSGTIVLIGGSWPDRKLSKIFQYDPSGEKLREVQNMTIPRSSHTVATIGERVYIVGGYTNGGAATNKCEMFDALTLKVSKLADSAYATTNSCLTAINGRSLVRIGGQLPDQTNCHNIEVYDCERNSWSTIDPNVDDVQGEFSLLSNSGSIQLNEHQIFVFGGYNEQIDNEVSEMSFIFDWSESDYRIREINLKPLPLAEGFWSSQPLLYNKKLYCLQNVPDPDSNNCLEDRRNVLVFNGRIWRVFDS